MSYVVTFDFVLAVLTVIRFGLYVAGQFLEKRVKRNQMLSKSGVTNENELAISRNLKTEL